MPYPFLLHDVFGIEDIGSAKLSRKLFSELNYEIEYLYILCDWYKRPKYKDVLDYIISVGCQYYFNYIPLHKLGLPVPNDND